MELLVIKNSSYTLVQKHCFSVSICHKNMSSAWGYAVPVTEEVLAMRGRGGGCTKSWWGFLSALFSYMYLSACGLQKSSPEGPLGLVLSDTVITGQRTNVVVYKTENKKELCFFFSFQSGRECDCAHIYWKWNDPLKNGWPINQIWQQRVNEERLVESQIQERIYDFTACHCTLCLKSSWFFFLSFFDHSFPLFCFICLYLSLSYIIKSILLFFF